MAELDFADEIHALPESMQQQIRQRLSEVGLSGRSLEKAMDSHLYDLEDTIKIRPFAYLHAAMDIASLQWEMKMPGETFEDAFFVPCPSAFPDAPWRYDDAVEYNMDELQTESGRKSIEAWLHDLKLPNEDLIASALSSFQALPAPEPDTVTVMDLKNDCRAFLAEWQYWLPEDSRDEYYKSWEDAIDGLPESASELDSMLVFAIYDFYQSGDDPDVYDAAVRIRSELGTAGLLKQDPRSGQTMAPPAQHIRQSSTPEQDGKRAQSTRQSGNRPQQCMQEKKM